MPTICHVNLARGYRGGERQTELLIRELADRGWNQRLIARAHQPLIERLFDVPRLERLPSNKPFLRRVWSCRNAIVHAHDAKAAKIGFAASRLFAIPYIVTRRIGKQPSGNRVTRAAYREADVLVGVAQSVAEVLRDYTQRDDVGVVPSASSNLGTNHGEARAIRKRWPARCLVVNVAALVDSQKGQSHLIAVARRLSCERRDIHFLLLGEGRDRALFETQAQDLTNVTILGFVDNVGDYLAAADVFVLPSRHEGIGGTCLDAMEFGLPIVASAVDGVPEIVTHGENGLLVPK